jgi:hypothetical protein
MHAAGTFSLKLCHCKDKLIVLTEERDNEVKIWDKGMKERAWKMRVRKK